MSYIPHELISFRNDFYAEKKKNLLYKKCKHFMSPKYITLLIPAVIVKATNGPRYVVGCRRGLDKTKLKQGTRVALDMTTLTIMR